MRQQLFVLIVLCLLGATAGCSHKPDYDVLILNGTIVDGSGSPRYQADVGISGDRIVKIGDLKKARAVHTIDARGLVVAPGFIDMLGQSEMIGLIEPRVPSKIHQGITTEVTGEGESIAPLNDALIKDMQPTLNHYHLTADWRTFGEYFKRFERRGMAINLGTFVGATQVREYVLDSENRPPTPEELEKMKSLVADAMKDGALGVSTSLIYSPAIYAKTDELIELAKVAAQFGGLYASHIRNEGDHINEALEEAFRIGREAKIPVEIWHLKVAGKDMWGKMPEVLKKIEDARASGLNVQADQYPYIAAATNLAACMPPWAHEGGNLKMIERLKDKKIRQRIKKEMPVRSDRWESEWYEVNGAHGILISSVLNPKLKPFEGKRIDEIAQLRGDADPMDTVMDLIIEDNAQTGAIYFSMSEADVKDALQKSWVGVDCDYGASNPSGVLADEKPHPRAYGTFPRILGKYVREEKTLSLETAIQKMTSTAASHVGFKDRGLLKAGYFADLTIFNPATVRDRATFEIPHQFPVGIEFVLVNGKIELENGQQTGVLAGRPLFGPGRKQ
ncbi:MAG: D-aminoacylase [Acidobacteriia bacterium]|nr:D-aminoacylase [Terriglobia bacterium]